VLREVARRTRAALPATVVGRWGGEELLVVLPGAGPAEARRVVALLAQAVRSSPIGAARVPVTASFGVATFPEDGDSLDLVRSAERALEAVKASRRDQRAHDQAARGRRPVAAR
jgi:diguanylate cyclase (GGDEF)-like protein